MPVEDVFELELDATIEDFMELDRRAADAERRYKKAEQDYARMKKTADRMESRQEKVQDRMDKITDRIEKRQTKALSAIEKRNAKVQSKLDKIMATVEDRQGRQFDSDVKKFFKERNEAINMRLKADTRERKERERFARLAAAIQRRHTDDRTLLQKIFGGGISSNPRVALQFFKNPASFIYSTMAVLPLLGGIMAAKDIADFIWRELVKIDQFYKTFINGAEDRINALRSREAEALIRTGYKQVIITTQAGSYEPRESYNSYEEFNTSRQDLENRFATRNNSGVP